MFDKLDKNYPKHNTQKAVALEYDEKEDYAPRVTAQGTGETAKNIIKIAQENGIPIQKDEDLVNMLSQIELNREIPIELYQAVSEVFSFIYSLSKQEDEKPLKKEQTDETNLI